MNRIAVLRPAGVSVVGTMQTENLGIERVVANVVANANIRFLLLCGEDTRQPVGHLPGQSLLALAQNGLDERGRIIGANGRRPVVKNVSHGTVEHFRRTVQLIDLIGSSDPKQIADSASACSTQNLGPAEDFQSNRAVPVISGRVPQRMVSDPNGYFVVFLDRAHNMLSLEHYTNGGVLDIIVEGRTASEIYFPVIDRGLISRLDHAAYLGRELARAEHALKTGDDYVQDAAPELESVPAGGCGCHTNCGEGE